MMRLRQPVRTLNRCPSWLRVMTLLCVSLLFCASTAQACHAHDALLHSADGKAQVSAPLDECPLCAAPHAALPAATQTTVDRTPQTEALTVAPSATSRKTRLPFHLFSRPPPVRFSITASALAGSDDAL